MDVSRTAASSFFSLLVHFVARQILWRERRGREIDDRGKSRDRVREVWVKSRPARCGYFRAVDSVVDEFAQFATESGDGTRRIETDAPVGKFQRQVPIDGVFTPTRPSGGVERSHGHGGIE